MVRFEKRVSDLVLGIGGIELQEMNYATQFEKYGMAFPAGSQPK
jgi:hypothetical protein